MNMPYLASTVSLEQVSVAEYMNSLPTLGMHDPSTAYDANSFIGLVLMPSISQQAFFYLDPSESDGSIL